MDIPVWILGSIKVETRLHLFILNVYHIDCSLCAKSWEGVHICMGVCMNVEARGQPRHLTGLGVTDEAGLAGQLVIMFNLFLCPR